MPRNHLAAYKPCLFTINPINVITVPEDVSALCQSKTRVRMIPQENRRIDSQMEGRMILSTMFDGTSNRQYGGKNNVTAVLYCKPAR
jgi:hypothetical protein